MIEKAKIEDMGHRFENLTGMKFNHLKVIELYGRKITKNCTQALWKCECDCDKHNAVLSTGYSLKSGITHCCEECRALEYPQNRISRTRIGRIWYGNERQMLQAELYGI